jgi:hypothetical protein
VHDVVVEVTDHNGAARPSLTLKVLPPGRFHVASDGPYRWTLSVASEALDLAEPSG